MVRDVFRTRNMRALPGTVGLGQVRYPTAGNAYSEEEAQPFYVNAPYGIVLVHNGNLTNAQALKKELFDIDRRHINTESDSEVLINVLAHEIERAARDDLTLTPEVLSGFTPITRNSPASAANFSSRRCPGWITLKLPETNTIRRPAARCRMSATGDVGRAGVSAGSVAGWTPIADSTKTPFQILLGLSQSLRSPQSASRGAGLVGAPPLV
jgi:hypothetical protein